MYKLLVSLALINAQHSFSGGEHYDPFKPTDYYNDHYSAELDSGFKEYMVLLANESVV